VTPEDLERIKLEECGYISSPLLSMIDMMRTYGGAAGGQVSSYRPDIVHPGVAFQCFNNKISEFGDTNNLSVLTFIDMMGHRFAFGGDLETAGWKALLRDRNVQDALAGVSIFIASHHGRESGYCEDVFKYADKVQLVVISDCEKKYESQEMTAIYRNHAHGGMFGGHMRYVVTTREGSLSWQQNDVIWGAA
jgi:beta-lactamase superfamily II metal-dependent hydrolase